MNRAGDHPRALGVGVALFGLASGLAAQALPEASAPQDAGGPTVLSPTLDLELLGFQTFDAAIEFEWRRNVDEIDPAGGGGSKDTSDRFREILQLGTSGFIGHPNLFELDLAGSLWLDQLHSDITGRPRERTDQTLYEWNVSGRAFKETDLPFTVYSRQNVSDLDRQFGGSIQNTFRETGLQLNLRHPVLPTNVRVYRREIDQEDTAVNRDFQVDRDTIAADGRIELGRAQRLAWDVEYDDIDETGDLREAQSFSRFESNATHTVEFGSAEQHTLRTRLRLYDETGDRALRQIRIDPRLRLNHAEELTTWYDYSFARDDRPEQQITTHRATANLQHQLFDSLTTIANGGFNVTDIPTDDFDSDELFAQLDLRYVKKVPYGRFEAGFNASGNWLDQSPRGASIPIADDARTFDAAGQFTIGTRNIVPSSLVITDVSGLFIYTEGIDYVVDAFPDQIRVRRLAGGDIAAGQTVLVDYIVGPDPGGSTDTRALGVEARYTLEEGPLRGLAGYVVYLDQNESRSILTDDFPENDFTDLRYGLEYDRGGLYVRAEHQRRDSTLAPFDIDRLEGRYTMTLGRGSNVVLSALYQDIDRDTGGRTRTTTLSGQWRQRVDDRLEFSFIAQYQRTDDTIGFDSDAFEQQFDVTWRRGRTEVYGQVRNTMNTNDADDRTFQRFIVGIRREF